MTNKDALSICKQLLRAMKQNEDWGERWGVCTGFCGMLYILKDWSSLDSNIFLHEYFGKYFTRPNEAYKFSSRQERLHVLKLVIHDLEKEIEPWWKRALRYLYVQMTSWRGGVRG